MLENREGGCHCGRVRFRARVDLDLLSQCSCTVCTKKGILHLPVAPENFELLRGKNSLSTYTFGTGVAQHTFCSHCGMHAFYVPRSQPDRILDGRRSAPTSRDNCGERPRWVDCRPSPTSHLGERLRRVETGHSHQISAQIACFISGFCIPVCHLLSKMRYALKFQQLQISRSRESTLQTPLWPSN
jgi:hypothetical protein